jgi:hypothetical protein
MSRKLCDRRAQSGPKFGLHGGVVDARRPVGDRTGVPPILME